MTTFEPALLVSQFRQAIAARFRVDGARLESLEISVDPPVDDLELSFDATQLLLVDGLPRIICGKRFLDRGSEEGSVSEAADDVLDESSLELFGGQALLVTNLPSAAVAGVARLIAVGASVAVSRRPNEVLVA